MESRNPPQTTQQGVVEQPKDNLNDIVRFRRELRAMYSSWSKNEQGAFTQRLRDLLTTTLPQLYTPADTRGLPIEVVDAIHVHETNRYLVCRLRYRVSDETHELIMVDLLTLSEDAYEPFISQFNWESAGHRLNQARAVVPVPSIN